jgi:hypothetical protein
MTQLRRSDMFLTINEPIEKMSLLWSWEIL